MQFVLIARHAPELCPSANAKIRKLMTKGMTEIPKVAEKLGVKIITLNVLGPDHEMIAVIEAKEIEAVRTFAMQSRLAQWNTVNINATWSMEEAMSKIGSLTPIF